MLFDCRPMSLFWEVASTLRSGREPGREEWQALFGTPGYQALTASEFPAGFFQKRWRLAYNPLWKGSGQALEEDDRFIRHYRRVMALRNLLGEFQNQLTEQPDMTEEIMDLARRYLPQGEYGDSLSVQILVFDYDARGYTPVVVDILYALENRDSLIPLLAHELHHQCVMKLRGIGQADGADQRSDLQWIVDQIHLEGMADMIDKVPWIEEGSAAALGYREQVDRAPVYIEKLDQGIAAMIRDRGALAQVSASLRSDLPGSGHPVGLYMAQLIAGQLGAERLIGGVKDPLAFLEDYREAASLAGIDPHLSARSVEFLRCHLGDDGGLPFLS